MGRRKEDLHIRGCCGFLKLQLMLTHRGWHAGAEGHVWPAHGFCKASVLNKPRSFIYETSIYGCTCAITSGTSSRDSNGLSGLRS